MSRCLQSLLSLIAVALFLSSPLLAEPGGRGGGGGGSYGGGRGGPSGGGAAFRAGGGAGPGGGGSHGGGGGGGSGGGSARGYAVRSPSSGAPRSGPAMSHGSPAHRSPSAPIGHPAGPRGVHMPYYGHWHHGDWHDRWSRPWYCGPVGWVSVGFVTGAVVWDAPWYWGYWPYYNPYCTEVIVVDNTRIDYSQPLVVTAASPGSAATATPSAAENEALQLLDAARNAFGQGDYQAAMTLVNQAIAKKPNDRVLHEFRALILFATKQYGPAAAAIYAVLSVGPGWNWPTLSSFYPDTNVYTGQLRALEQYRNEHPNQPEIRFLMAYHCIACGQTEAAKGELEDVVRLSPKDQLSAQLLAGLTGASAATNPAPSQPAAPSQPVTAASLVGNWEATRSDGASFAFRLAGDATYSWHYTKNGQSQQFQGAYTMADNLLILKTGGNPTMIGQITLLDANRFNFKLAGSNPSDSGLTFSRK